jgi:hypothetical protein
MRRHATILFLCGALVGMGVPSATAALAATRITGAAVVKPTGYSIVSATFPLPNGFQTAGSVACPIKKGVQTVPFSGGALVDTTSADASISSSFPLPDGWAVDVNNTTGAASDFSVYAVCANKPEAYVQKESTTPVLADSFAQTGFGCPKGDVLLGGGARSGSSSPLVSLNSSYPESTTSWSLGLNNPTSSSLTMSHFQVCAKLNVAKISYEIVAPPGTDDPPGQLVETEALCPGGRSVLGGGINATGSLGISINSTLPLHGAWAGDESNASTVDATVATVVLCAF